MRFRFNIHSPVQAGTPLGLAIALLAMLAAPGFAQEAAPAEGEGSGDASGFGFALEGELDIDVDKQLSNWISGGGKLLIGEDIGGKFWAFSSETGNPFTGGAGWIKQYEFGENFGVNLQSSVTDLKGVIEGHAVATVDPNGQVRMSAGAKTGFGDGRSSAEIEVNTDFLGGDVTAKGEVGINHGLFLGADGDLAWGDGQFKVSAEIDFLGLHLAGSFDWKTSEVQEFIDQKILQAKEWKDKAWQGIKSLFPGSNDPDPMSQPSIFSSMPDPGTESLLDWLQYSYNQPLPPPGAPVAPPPSALQGAVGPDGTLNLATPWVESR